MRVLVTWGSKLGGTAGIAQMLTEVLRERGHDVVASPAHEAPTPDDFDAVIVGGALYANRWHADARRYLERHAPTLRRVPTWLFSSGPLDDSAEHDDLPAPRPIRALASRIGAIEHVTFGGRLEATARGFPAAAMAKEHAGDWRDPDRIRAWAREIDAALPTAEPRRAVEPPARSPVRLVEYGVVGWGITAATLALALAAFSSGTAIVLHAIVAPAVFAWLAVRYHGALGARGPLPTAIAWTAIVGVLHAVFVAGAIQRDLALLTSVGGYWVPLALVFGASWAAGAIATMLPFPQPAKASRPAAATP